MHTAAALGIDITAAPTHAPMVDVERFPELRVWSGVETGERGAHLRQAGPAGFGVGLRAVGAAGLEGGGVAGVGQVVGLDDEKPPTPTWATANRSP